MKKVNLKKIQVVAGVAYGPGEVEVDEKVAKRLKGEDVPASAAPAKGEDLEQYTVVELKDRAKERGVEGYSTMNKADLIAALEK